MSETVKLVFSDKKEIELPVTVGTENEKGIDVSNLRAQTGYITLDPGYVNTGACKSSITFIDGDAGILRYRGIPIETLAEKGNFLEIAYLLLFSKLPTKTELADFEGEITRHTMLQEDVKRFFDGFPRDAHPMAILASVVVSLSTFYQEESNEDKKCKYDINIIRLLAKVPTIAAYAYKKYMGLPFMYPDNSRSYVENFLYMMFGNPCEDYKVDPEVVKVLNLLLILHADHEQNCSTSTVRIVRSSMANLYASIAAGICALWGPRHGGANQEVIEMLEHMQSSGVSVTQYIEKIKNKEKGVRLMGFGHRVYKNYDPRAKIIKAACDTILKKLNVNDPLLSIAKELEEAAFIDGAIG